jgi:uroporphyrinogen-III synthase
VNGVVRPLDGVTVVITRPVEQAHVLADLLHERGATTVVMPLIELVDVAPPDEIDAALAELGDDDWVVVASAHAASRVRGALEGALDPGSVPCAAKVAAVGTTTAASLPRTDLVAERQSAEGLVAIFPEGSGRAVVVQAADGAPTLVDGLGRRGWTVRRINTHRSQPVVPTAAQQLAVLRADAVVFTSGTQADAWVKVFGTSAPPVIVTIGPQTTEKTQLAGLKVTRTAADHSLPGVLEALEVCFRG